MSEWYRRRKEGKQRMWCVVCQEWFATDDEWDGICPRCGLTVSTFKCGRCGHEWTPRSPGRLPERCPSCKSPYWNRDRVRDPLTLRRLDRLQEQSQNQRKEE